MNAPKRYHPALVTLHWLVAALVFLDLGIGYFYIRPILTSGFGGVRSTDPILKIHMAAGVTILVLLIVRFIIRLMTPKPAPADAGWKPLNILARVVHYSLYFFVFAITIVGLIFSLQTNRFQVAFMGATAPNFGPGGGFPRPANGTPFPNPNGNGAPGFNNPGAPGFPPPGNGPRPDGRGGFGFLLLPIHFAISIVVIALLTLHILAAFYHQFFRRDHLLSRMWYGKA